MHCLFVFLKKECLPEIVNQVEIRDDSKPNVHVAFGVESVGWSDPRYLVFAVLQTIIGQWSRTDGKNELF
jgi:hypothetical protein